MKTKTKAPFELYNGIHAGTDCLATRVAYIETNNRVEKWCKIADFILARFISIAFMLPKPILSYFMYFTTNLGPDAFELTFPVWYKS